MRLIPKQGIPRLQRVLIAVLAPLLLAGCGDQEGYPMSTVRPLTEFADTIHSLYVTIFFWTMLILAVVWGLLAYIILRYRRRSDDERPRQVRGHMGLEIGWTVGPALIVVAITVPTIQAVFETQETVSEESVLVEVTGNQFWWQFHYPDYGVTTANELRLPVNRPVDLRLESSDVIHSFWVPLFGGKRDVNPTPEVREGVEPRYNWLYFTPRETGVFRGQCAEFCGTSHALMAMRVVVEEEAGFEGWVERWQASEGAAPPAGPDEGGEGEPEEGAGSVAEEGTGAGGGSEEAAAAGGDTEVAAAGTQQAADEPPQVTAGREIFLNSTCVACHGIQGTTAQGVIAPNLTLFGSRTTLGAGILENNQENLVRWITDPHSIKPGVAMPGVDTRGGNWPPTGLSEEEVRAVAAYLLSLE